MRSWVSGWIGRQSTRGIDKLLLAICVVAWILGVYLLAHLLASLLT